MGRRVVGAELSADFDEVWADFAASERTLGPSTGSREEWHRGRRDYAVWLLPVRHPEVVAEVSRLQALLAPFIRPVPLDELHITVWVLGFPTAEPTLDDDVELGLLARSQGSLRADPPGACRLRLGPPGSFRSAAILEARDPHGDLVALRGRLLDGPPEQRFAEFRPHLTLGTYTADHPVPDVLRALQGERHGPSVDLRLDELVRVELDAWSSAAPMRTVDRHNLSTHAPSEPPCESS